MYSETGFQLAIRIFHDVMHVLLFLVSIPLLLGFFNESIKEFMERFDYGLHLLFVMLCAHSLYEWVKLRQERKAHAEHHKETL